MTTTQRSRSSGLRARYAYELDRVGYLTARRDTAGDVFPLDDRRIVVCDPHLIHEVLAKTGAEFLAGHDALHGFARESADRIAAWMRGRRVGWQGVNPAMLAAHGRRLDASLRRDLAALAGREFGVVAQAQDIMARAAVDFCVSRDNDELADAAAAASLAQLAVQDTVPAALSWLPYRAIRRGRAADRRMRAAIDACIERRTGAPAPTPDDLLDVLRANGGFGQDDLARTLKRTLVGAHGVPGAALAWVIREIGSRPDVTDAIRAEGAGYAEAVASGSTDALPYTDAVVKEVLRLYPPVWMMTREVVQPASLGGHSVLPGQHVLLPTYLVHRDGRYWTDDPAEFRPERWLVPAGGTQPHARYAYLPFGGGPRMCLGHRLGSFQLVLAAQAMLAAHDVELVNDDAASPAFNVVLTPAKLVARLMPRRDR
jgi:unspecific monooxygenase